VEDYELFNFDREVAPILDVIVSKTLEEVETFYIVGMFRNRRGARAAFNEEV
jgi:Radial spoke protein 3